MMEEMDRRAEKGRRDEDAYFRERDFQLLEGARQAEKAKAERAAMGQILGVDDDAVLTEFQQIGFDAETVRLLPILPLVRVAWAEGFVTGRERSAVLEAAKSIGVAEGSEAYGILQTWLEEPPNDPFYEPCLHLLGKVVREGQHAPFVGSLQEIIAACTKIAAVSGGFFGFGVSVSEVEQAVIGRVNAALLAEPSE